MAFKRALTLMVSGGLLWLLGMMPLQAATLLGQAFSDVAGHWAERDISRMKAFGMVNGDETGAYRPDAPVTGQEAVIMLIRALGKEVEARGKTLPSGYANLQQTSPWAREIVAQGIQEGILAGAELSSFKPLEAARRFEVAVMAGRALGFSQEAAASAGVKLGYNDTAQVPAAAVGFVAVLQREGLMAGDEKNNFRPLATITRAEMAVLLSRVESRLGKHAASVLKGEVFSVSPQTAELLLVVSDGSIRTVAVAAEATLFLNSSHLTLSTLMKGDKVELVLKDGKVFFLRVLPADQFSFEETKVQGTLQALLLTGNSPTLTLNRPSGPVTYRFLAGALEVLVGGKSGSSADLAIGQEAALVVLGPLVKRVEISAPEAIVSGKIGAISATSLTVSRTGGGAATFTLDKDTQILLDSQTAAVADLYPGQVVEVTSAAGRAARVSASRLREDFSNATVVGVTFVPRSSVLVKLAGGPEKTFPVADNATIRRGGANVTLRDLLPGDTADLQLLDGVVQSVNASVSSSEVEGRIQALTMATNSRLTVLAQGKEEEYILAADASITRSGKQVQLRDLQVGDYVRLSLQGRQAVKVVVTARTTQDYLIGQVADINQTARVVIIRSREGDLKQVYLGLTYNIYRLGSSVSLGSVRAGDEVIAVGRVENSVFMGSLIVVVAGEEN